MAQESKSLKKTQKDPAKDNPSTFRIVSDEHDSLLKKADQFVETLLNIQPGDLRARESKKSSVENIGLETQKKAALQMQLLREPIKKLSTRSSEGGEVADALIDLKTTVEELDPRKFDFEPGWFSRAIGKLPGVGTPMKRYFTQFESAQSIISSIIRSLESGREQLRRDNLTLLDDQHQMREMTLKLGRAIELGKLIDLKLEGKIRGELLEDHEKIRFISEELLYPLRQRVMDLQQQLAVNQQGVLATEIIIRNNKELIRGVDRSLSVTVTALQVAATVAMALAHQKIVLDKVDSVNQTTSELIAGTASRLRLQGANIQKRATAAQLDMDSLRSAFVDIRAALDDISQFRLNALPQMSATVQELDRVTQDANQAIAEMEQGNAQRPEILIDLED